MKICQTHWDKLRANMVEQGLDHLVSNSGEEVTGRMVEGKFDPLMHAHNAIVQNAINSAGLTLLVMNDDGSHKCPICFLQAEHDKQPCPKVPPCPAFATWLDRAVEDARAVAAELGLVPKGGRA